MYALNIAQIQHVKEQIHPELVAKASLLTDSMFDELGMKVTTDVENIDVCYIFNEKGLQARPYVVGNVEDSQLGEFIDNPAKLEKIVLHTSDSIERYTEKGPFQDTNVVESAEHTAFLLGELAKRTADDVRANVFHGNMANRSLQKTAANMVKIGLSLFDGFYTLIAKGITDGTISAANGNYFTTGDLLSNSVTPVQAYDAFVEFYNSLNPALQQKDEILIGVCKKLAAKIVKGYMLTYPQIAPTVLENGWKFAEFPNVKLVTSAAMGVGSQIYATVEGNFEYLCSDREQDAMISIGQVNKDLRVFDYQANCRATVRIRDYSPKVFAVNEQLNSPLGVPVGDYIVDIFTVTSSDTNEGTVAITSGQKDLYQEGDIITVTATPATGGTKTYQFAGWSDGSTANPYNYVFKGGRVNLVAQFEETE